MSISIGGIDLPNAIINLEYELARTQRLLEWVLNNNIGVLKAPPRDAVQKIDADSLEFLKKKYPDAGIEKK